jgi:two-component system chemotaxis response regulator CheY
MQKTVLIVDDSSTFRSVLRFALEPAGYAVLEAADGEAALAALQGTRLCAIVCDVHMPVLDGLAFIAEVKRQQAHKFVPVVMLTTEARSDYTERGHALGVRAWMIKPFKPSELLATLQRVVV